MDFRDVLIALISETCDYVPLHGKRDFADVIKGLDVGRLFWNVQWAQCNHGSSCKRKSKAEGSASERGT